MGAAGVPVIIAGALGGKMLEMKPFIISDRIRNYDGIFLISTVIAVLCLAMSIYFNFETEDEKKKREADNLEIEPSGSNIEDSISSSLQQLSNANQKKFNWRRFINMNSLKNIWNAISRKRDNLVHVELWLIFVAYSLNYLVMSASDPLFYPFAQKVFMIY